MKANDIIQVLKKEIGWCSEHPDTNPNQFQKGFEAGLRQAIHLVAELEKLQQAIRLAVTELEKTDKKWKK